MKDDKKVLKMVNDVIENFDFDRTHFTMKKLNWVWESCRGVPDINTLKFRAEELIWNAVNGILEEKNMSYHSSYFSATGGLKATALKNRYNRISFIRLEFILTDWESDGD